MGQWPVTGCVDLTYLHGFACSWLIKTNQRTSRQTRSKSTY